jgi:hypothetical protein
VKFLAVALDVELPAATIIQHGMNLQALHDTGAWIDRPHSVEQTHHTEQTVIDRLGHRSNHLPPVVFRQAAKPLRHLDQLQGGRSTRRVGEDLDCVKDSGITDLVNDKLNETFAIKKIVLHLPPPHSGGARVLGATDHAARRKAHPDENHEPPGRPFRPVRRIDRKNVMNCKDTRNDERNR